MTATSLEKLSPRTNYDLIGHNENINFILNCYKKKRLHQAYLFSGNEGIGKATFAYSFARFLLSDTSLDSFNVNKNEKVSRLIESNTHPDLLVIEPNIEKKDRFISIDQARKCSEFFNHTPSISKWRVCIIDSIDFMDISTSNTILKILEEPPSYCIFLIIAQKVDAVIETIRSRCVELRFKDIEEDILIRKLKLLRPELLDSEILSLVNLSDGSFGALNNLIEENSIEIYKTIESIASEKIINSSIYSFSDFILKEDGGSNKFNLFINCIIFKTNSLIKSIVKSSTSFAINEGLDLREKMLELIRQERVFKLNRKQTIINLILNLNKIANLE